MEIEGVPDPIAWALHVVLNMGKLMAWAFDAADSAQRTQLLRQVEKSARHGADVIAEMLAGGDRKAMLERVSAVYRNYGVLEGAVMDDELPPI